MGSRTVQYSQATAVGIAHPHLVLQRLAVRGTRLGLSHQALADQPGLSLFHFPG
jgi:hypothetical protein